MRPIEVLMAEDNEDDIELTREAFAESKFHVNLHVTRDGVDALAFLRREAGFETAVRPDIVLLDLNMPRKDGREVLQEIREDPALKYLPVVILTTSGREEDVLNAYEFNVNCYVRKPVDFAQFMRVVEMINEFWITVVVLPPRSK